MIISHLVQSVFVLLHLLRNNLCFVHYKAVCTPSATLSALFGICRFEVKHVSGMGGRSPPRGGAAAGAANQQFLADSDEEATDERDVDANTESDSNQKASKRRKVGTAIEVIVLVSTLNDCIAVKDVCASHRPSAMLPAQTQQHAGST